MCLTPPSVDWIVQRKLIRGLSLTQAMQLQRSVAHRAGRVGSRGLHASCLMLHASRLMPSSTISSTHKLSQSHNNYLCNIFYDQRIISFSFFLFYFIFIRFSFSLLLHFLIFCSLKRTFNEARHF